MICLWETLFMNGNVICAGIRSCNGASVCTTRWVSIVSLSKITSLHIEPF